MAPVSFSSLWPRLLALFAGVLLLSALIVTAIASGSGSQPLESVGVTGTPSYLPISVLQPTATPLPSPTPAGIPQVVGEIALPEGGCANKAVVNPYTGWVYVSNNGNNTLSILDASQYLSTVPAGNGPSHLSADPNSARVFVTNLRSSTVDVYNYYDLVTSLTTDGETHDVLYNPVNNNLYVSTLTGNVNVYDGTTYEKFPKIDFLSGWVLGLAMDNSTGLVYAANYELGKVFTIDGITSTATVQAGWGAEELAVDSVTGYVYAAHSSPSSQYPQNISVMQDNQLVVTATTAIRSTDVEANPTTGLAYFSNIDNDTVTILSGAQVIGNIAVGARPSAVAVNPNTGYVFVANRTDNTVTVIEGGTVVATYETGIDPVDIVVDTERDITYVVSRGEDCSVGAKVTILR